MPSSKTTTSITKPNNALAKAVQPDAALSAVVGSAPLPRTELTKKIWEYIRKHELQDPKEENKHQRGRNTAVRFRRSKTSNDVRDD